MSLDLSLWRSRIEQMVGLQAQQHRRWREAQAMVEGKWGGEQGWLLDPDFTPVNYGKAYLSATLAAIYAQHPYSFVQGSRKYLHFARSMETVLNYFKRELGLKQVYKRCIVDALLTGIGWAEVGYTATFGETHLAPQEETGMFQKLLGTFKRPAEQGVLNEYVKEVSPFLTRLSPWKVYLAPGYHDPLEMPYLTVAEDIAPEDLANHPLYKRLFSLPSNIPTRKVELGNTPLSTAGMQRTFGAPATSRQLQLARLYHVWNRREAQRFIWLEGTMEVAGPFDWPYSFEGFAQSSLVFNDLPENDRTANGYPIGDLTFLMPQLKELSLLRTQMVKHRKRSGGIILVNKNGIDVDQRRRIQQSEDLTLVEINGTPGTDIGTFTPGTLSPDVYQVGNRILADLDLIGQLGFILPTISGQERSATEANFRAQGASTLRSEKVDVLEEFIQRNDRKLAAVVWEFCPRSLIAAILGEEQLPEELWPELPTELTERREIIERELHFKIEAGSTQPLKDKTLKNEQKIRLLNILGGIAPERIKVTSEGLGQLVEDFEMPELASWMILDDEGEQQAALQENELLMQGVPQVVTPNENHQLHEQVHAQAMQQGSTPAMDQHLLQHRQFREAKQPQKKAQAGDGGATRGAAAKPEAQRQGVTSESDLLSVMGQAMREGGQEKGGMPNGPV